MPVLSVLARETVKGTVLDAKGNPIPGVRVEIPGNSEYVFTDLDGAFQIILREPTKNLKFTYPGYSPSTYKIKPEMTVVLGKGWAGHERGVRGMIDLEGGMGFRGNSTFKYGGAEIKDLHTFLLTGPVYTLGYQINRHLFVGIGAGVYMELSKYQEVGGYDNYPEFPVTGAEFPLFAIARWDFGLTKKTAPYVDIRMGYNVFVSFDPTISVYSSNNVGSNEIEVSQENHFSWMIAPSVGYRVNIHKKFGMNFGLRLIMGREKKYTVDTEFYNRLAGTHERSYDLEFKQKASNVLMFNIGFDM